MERVILRKFFATFFAVFSVLQFSAIAARSTVSVNGGTKVASSTTNSLVDNECQDSYFGCMDAFCMVDNISGGRCQCSNKHTDLSAQFNALLEQEERADTIAEYGVDFVKDSNLLEEVEKIANDAKPKAKEPKQKSLSRADWDNMFAVQDEEEEEEFVDDEDISNKHGDDLYIAADKMCVEQTPSKCQSTVDMLKMMYAQKIKSDCVAFENSIKQNKLAVNEKVANAEKTVRDAALAEFENANKYGLGQCTRAFKQCMQTTAGCGGDFVNCVSWSANENVSKDGAKVEIAGALSSVEISASTMDALSAKRVLCDSVLENCVNVRDDVWGTFLREISDVLKMAEATAENNLRSSCIKTISDCYIKACREHMDVNDPEGSYDMCLSRPENYKSFCKIELEPCLAATGGSYEKPSESRLWVGVLAELASLRVDACNKEFKACIQDEDRCGEDYSQCIGLDGEDIALLCPDDKLTACYYEYDNNKETVRETLARVADGIMAEVHFALTEACEKAVDDAMFKTCGSVDNCNELLVGNGVGGRSLELQFCEYDATKNQYTNCKQTVEGVSDNELGKTIRNADLSKTEHEAHGFSGVMTGQIEWNLLSALPDNSGVISVDEYVKQLDGFSEMDSKVQDKIKTEVGALGNAIKDTIAAIESDAYVQFCMTGRTVSGLVKNNGFEQFIGKSDNPTFPNITQIARMKIINGAIVSAQTNYHNKYAELTEAEVNGIYTLNKRYAEINEANRVFDEQDANRKRCMELGEKAAFSMNKSGSGAKYKIERNHGNDEKLVGWSAESTYNFKRQVTTTFNMDKMICTKCTRTQACDYEKSNWCKVWDKEQEECTDIQY